MDVKMKFTELLLITVLRHPVWQRHSLGDSVVYADEDRFDETGNDHTNWFVRLITPKIQIADHELISVQSAEACFQRLTAHEMASKLFTTFLDTTNRSWTVLVLSEGWTWKRKAAPVCLSLSAQGTKIRNSTVYDDCCKLIVITIITIITLQLNGTVLSTEGEALDWR